MSSSSEAAPSPTFSLGHRAARLGALLAAGVVVGVWGLSTPGGLLGKADAVAYAVCHRIDVRSFHLGERPLPLCARCTGLYLGSMLTFVFFALLGRVKAGMNPARRLWIPLGAFGVLYAIDGVNSYLHFFPNAPHGYPPSNVLRLVTGTFAGVALVALIFPTLNQMLWRDWRPQAALRSWRELVVLCAAAVGLILLVLTGNALILYPLALISSLGVVVLLTFVHTTLVAMITGRGNRATHVGGLLTPLLAGVTLAFLQLGGIDLVRYVLTGTWGGFVF